MRLIKFRAWNTAEKEMVIPCAYVDENGVFILKDSKFYHESDGKLIWMQFTGLLDKNGKEIYEGDIIGYRDEDIRPVVRFGEYCFIDDECGAKGVGFYLEHFEYGKAVDMQRGGYSSPASTNMVIGNIYENEDLAPKENN